MAQSFSSHDIYETLYNEIMTLQLKPGAMLRENELCARFAVSRTPVRSVLQELRINGLVEVTPYKSTRVTQLDFDTITQQIYMRVAVEGAVLSDYCAVVTPEQLTALRARNDVLRRLAAAPAVDSDRFYQIDSRLHQSWFTAMHKQHLWQLIQTSQNHYARFRMLDLVEAHNFGEIVDEHTAMLDALAGRDIPALLAENRKHLYGGVARLGRLDTRLPAEFADYFVPGSKWPTEF